ncbi:MAG TPA: Flp family type IVb pilin [Thermodesulfovibrionales bacterium]|nr:Flp family type IVb pilin [Thermodesulfovibrionales bacterium]
MKALKEMYEKVSTRLLGFLYSEEGQGLVEYALILVLIALVIIAMLKGVGQSVNTVYSKINSGLQ